MEKTRAVHLCSTSQISGNKVVSAKEQLGRSKGRDSHDRDFPVETRPWKGQTLVQEHDELMLDFNTSNCSVDSLDNGGTSSFLGASHPPEPVDKDLMRPICVPIGPKKLDKDKGPFLADLSIQVPPKKPIPVALSPTESSTEEVNGLNQKDGVWDASLPPSGSASPLSSVGSTSVVKSVSVINSKSSYRSDGIINDGVLTTERNCQSTKCSVRGESLESAKTSMSRTSDSSGLSDDSNWSNHTGGSNKPHKGNDPRWKAIIALRSRDGILGMSHFRLLKQLGCGDIGRVYLSELSGTLSHFAMKVVDKESLSARKKLNRAQTEREILQLFDHPFLPTLYTHFETDRFSCLVMEYCPGGDLHTLRQRQPGKHFSEYAARFYAAEILMALEYLHMLGVIYRDLKPENVLVRDDGHIMLSDFDLSLRCVVSPTLVRTSTDSVNGTTFCVQPSCIEPSTVCIRPACFLPRLFPKKNKKKTKQAILDQGLSPNTLPELNVEPTQARSMSFVGTHEYLAPEIIKGEGHGSAVDWWTFGVFLHELLYGKTPFKGFEDRATLFNVVGQQLKFPDSPTTSYAARDLIRGLLVKEPQNRLGVKRGATEIKQHPFFDGVNWALIRCSTPPEIPRRVEMELNGKVGVGNASRRMPSSGSGKYLDFEFF